MTFLVFNLHNKTIYTFPIRMKTKIKIIQKQNLNN